MSAQILSSSQHNRGRLLAGIVTVAFLLAIGLRWLVGGRDVAQSYGAGLVFAACLWGLYAARPSRCIVTSKVLLQGILGGLFICIPTLAMRLSGGEPHMPQGNFFVWSLVIVIVAVAEEAVLRGMLFDIYASWKGTTLAVIAAAVLFALLHVPLYGWQVVPLDFMIGLWFGGLRVVSGSWTAPAIAHTLADLIAWWIK